MCDTIIHVFDRIEQKYLISKKDYNDFKIILNKYFNKDTYYYSNIRNLYFENKYNDVVNSLYTYKYRYKYRIRSYKDIDSDDDLIFMEIKSKINGINYKRRAIINYREYKDYVNNNIFPNKYQQIIKEIDYYIKKNELEPYLYVGYDRYSYCSKEDENLRLTIDFNLRYRFNDLGLFHKDSDKLYFDNNDTYILELKSDKGLPMWLSNFLLEHKLYRIPFSKIKKIIEKEMRSKDD